MAMTYAVVEGSPGGHQNPGGTSVSLEGQEGTGSPRKSREHVFLPLPPLSNKHFLNTYHGPGPGPGAGDRPGEE